MSAMVDRLLELARSQIETKEFPPGSNNVKYNTAYYGREVSGDNLAWCAVFIWWLFRECGISGLYYGGQKTAYVPTLLTWGRNAGLLVKEPRPGDLVCFDFNHNASADHIGICEDWDGAYVTTIDGNTGTASENNGGCVMRRRRHRKYIVAVIRPKYESEGEEMDFDKLLEQMTDEQALKLSQKIDAARGKEEPNPDWGEEARSWGTETGLISGDEHGEPLWEAYVTRNQLVTILYKFYKMVLKTIQDLFGKS